MARLPSLKELGFPTTVANTREDQPDFRATREAAERITTTASRVGQGARALGQGIAQLGEGIASGLQGIQGTNDRLNAALAESSWASSTANLNDALSDG